jgi:hypothetical protein
MNNETYKLKNILRRKLSGKVKPEEKEQEEAKAEELERKKSTRHPYCNTIRHFIMKLWRILLSLLFINSIIQDIHNILFLFSWRKMYF